MRLLKSLFVVAALTFAGAAASGPASAAAVQGAGLAAVAAETPLVEQAHYYGRRYYQPRRFYRPRYYGRRFYRPRPYYGRRFYWPRVVCRIRMGYYGPRRVCFRR